MTLWILNQDFETVRLVTKYESLTWTKKWLTVGEFELVVPDSYSELAANIKNPLEIRYVFRSDSNYIGRIDNIVYEDGLIVASGYFLENLLSFRVDHTRIEYSGVVEDVIHNIVKNNCINNKPISYLILGENNKIGDEINADIFGKNLKTYLYDDLSAVHGNSYNIRYDRDLQKIVFSVLWGKDRTQEQVINDWCLFGQQWGNVYSEKFDTNTNYANYATVWGEGEDEKRVYEIVDIRQDLNEELREISIDARDIQKKELSDKEYKQALRDRGLQKLSEDGKFENIYAEVKISPNMPYSLGDIVSVKHDRTAMTFYLRITEEREVFEGNKIERKISFGERQGGIMSAIKQGV